MFFARVAAAAVVGTPVQGSDGDFPATEPDIVWNGAGYGIARKEPRNGGREVVFREFDPLGAEAIVLSEGAGNSSAASLAYNGSSYAVSWQKRCRQSPTTIYDNLSVGAACGARPGAALGFASLLAGTVVVGRATSVIGMPCFGRAVMLGTRTS